MKYSYDEKCLDLARHFFPTQSIAFLEALAQEFQDCVEGREDDADIRTLPIPDFLRNQDNLRAERNEKETPSATCSDCPPIGYPTDKTRCAECPRMETSPAPADPDEETPCPEREDGMHCECWYGGEPCCACGVSDILDGREKAPCSAANR